MEQFVKADLHMHTVFSDGTDDLDELIEKLIESKIQIFSITDHDTILGSTKMLTKQLPDSMSFIPGVEFSCITVNKEKCHILGYAYDSDHPAILQLMEKARNKRKEKHQTRINTLRDKYGIQFTDEALTSFESMVSVGKPHLAKELIKMGVVSTKEEAMVKYLNQIKTGSNRMDAKEVIKAIRSAGGIVIWAHPLGGEGEPHLTFKAFIKELETLIEYGVEGLECWYSRFSKDEISSLLNIAEEKNLFVSGGSDYHGKNKKIELGTLNNYGYGVKTPEISIIKELNVRKKLSFCFE